jgi:hypothetical protein
MMLSVAKIIYYQWEMTEWVWSTGVMVLTEIKWKYSEKTFPVPLCPPQTVHHHCFGASPLRGQEVTAWTMAWLPAGCSVVLWIKYSAAAKCHSVRRRVHADFVTVITLHLCGTLPVVRKIFYIDFCFSFHFLVTEFYFNRTVSNNIKSTVARKLWWYCKEPA